MILRGPSRPDFLLDEGLADVFEATVSRQPEKTALIFGTLQLTCRDLDEAASLMAHHLIGQGLRSTTAISARWVRASART